MRFLPLFLSNLKRKPVRTGLTIASIVVAFMLLGLLKTLQAALELGADFAGVDRLVTMHRVSLIQQFPRSYLNRIEAIEGVEAAASFNWFGGLYQDERNQFATYTTDPELFFGVYPEYELIEGSLSDWTSDRTSMIIGSGLADRFGWQIGDVIPVRSNIYQKNDGSTTWDLRLVGIYHASNGDNGSAYFHYDYLNESFGNEYNQIGFVGLRVEDPERLREVASRIDALFANSPAETKTDTERAFVQGFANQMGDIGAIVTAVVSAVFFTILLVTGNTMAQSVRERTSEFAVLKTLGFTNPGVATMVLAESFVITAVGGVIGLALATAFAGQASAALQQFFPILGVPPSAYSLGAVLIVALSVVSALLPSMQAARLRITNALRRG